MLRCHSGVRQSVGGCVQQTCIVQPLKVEDSPVQGPSSTERHWWLARAHATTAGLEEVLRCLCSQCCLSQMSNRHLLRYSPVLVHVANGSSPSPLSILLLVLGVLPWQHLNRGASLAVGPTAGGPAEQWPTPPPGGCCRARPPAPGGHALPLVSLCVWLCVKGACVCVCVCVCVCT